MQKFPRLGYLILAGFACTQAWAQQPGQARPNLVLEQIVEALPKSDKQQVRVLTAVFNPGDVTVHHTHRYPVTVYVLEGAFTLQLAGQPPIVIKAGQAYVEPPNVRMIGANKSTTEKTKVVIFYVSSPDTPFLDPIK